MNFKFIFFILILLNCNFVKSEDIFSTSELSFCKKELPIFNKEIIRRIEPIYITKDYYKINKKEIDYYLPEICSDNPFVHLEFKNFMENMGYGVSITNDYIVICKENPCSLSIIDNATEISYTFYIRLILGLLFLLYGIVFILQIFKNKAKDPE